MNNVDSLVESAESLAREHLESLGDRWKHTVGVAMAARKAAVILPESEQPLLIAAAWLHDIGYAQAAAQTGLHSLDGAQLLVSLGFARRLCALVAHHSCAQKEASERGIGYGLLSFPREEGALADALIYADMTTGPTGSLVDVATRIDEILQRYPASSPVHRAIRVAAEELILATARTKERLWEQRSPQGSSESQFKQAGSRRGH